LLYASTGIITEREGRDGPKWWNWASKWSGMSYCSAAEREEEEYCSKILREVEEVYFNEVLRWWEKKCIL
jgi:hypothetical protein